MNNLVLTLHGSPPELGEIISDASSNPIIKVEMEPYYAPVPVWMASLEFNGRTYRLYVREIVEDEPDQDLIDVYKKYALDDENEPSKRVMYRCEHQGHCKLYHRVGVEIEPDVDCKWKLPTNEWVECIHCTNKMHPDEAERRLNTFEPDYGNPHTEEIKYRCTRFCVECMKAHIIETLE